jgi:hypothetical protein
MRAFTACRGLSEHSKFTMHLVEMLISWYTKKVFGCGAPGLGSEVELSITVQRFGSSSSPGPEALNLSNSCLYKYYINFTGLSSKSLLLENVANTIRFAMIRPWLERLWWRQ